MTAYRNVAALILASMLLQAAAGILNIATPLHLDALGANAAVVGAVAAVFALGFMLGAWYSPDTVRSIGHIRAYSAAAAIYAAGILAMPLFPDIFGWGALRFAQGAASAIMFASAESWIADSTPIKQRGSVMGLYQVLIKLALAAGPLLLFEMAPDDWRPFVIAGIFMVLAVVPLCATRKSQPVLPRRGSLGFKAMLAITPAAMAGAIVAGFANAGVNSQLALFAVSARPDLGQQAAVILYGASMLGGVATQWPAGLISDRIDRRWVVAALGLVAMLAALALFWMADTLSWGSIVLLSALWGGGSMSFYSVAASHAIDRVELDQIAQVMSGMLFVWAAASVVGPIVMGVVADGPLGHPGVFLASAIAYAGLVLASIGRLAFVARPKRKDRTNFAPILATSVVAGEIEQDLAEEFASETAETAADSTPDK